MYKYQISVIIPVYNVEKYLNRCLKSVFSQTFQDFQVICVNDCTPDNSMQILEHYKQKYPDKMTIVNNTENRGLGATRDNGLKHAEGRYIAFIDSDDCIKKDYLETYYNKIIEDDYDMVSGGYIIVRDNKKIHMNQNPDKHSKWLWPSAWAKLYKHSFLTEHNLDFRGIRIYEDEPFTYRVMFCNPKVALLNYCGYYYVMNDGSITQSKSKESRINSFNKYLISTEALVQEAEGLKLSNYEHNIFEFSIMSGLIANALYNGKSSGSEAMSNVHEECFRIMETYFPEYMTNPYFHMCNLPKLEFKKLICTWLIIFAARFDIDKFLFKIV